MRPEPVLGPALLALATWLSASPALARPAPQISISGPNAAPAKVAGGAGRPLDTQDRINP